MRKVSTILAIESSCDESAAAIVRNGREVLANVIYSQIADHKKTGGVVPEVAAREHVKHLPESVKKALEESKLDWSEIDAIAYTKEPGLAGCLRVGRAFAESLAWAKDKPLIPVNHIHGHLYSNFLDRTEEPVFPILTLTVSGGHNDLILMSGHGDIKVIGSTLDDAAGEAFDKVARYLGLGYPGGPAIEARALNGDSKAIKFPVPKMSGFNFSFSGLKTAVLYYLQANEDKLQNSDFINDVAASFQAALIESELDALMRAVKHYEPREIHLAGGCSANSAFRQAIENGLSDELKFRYPTKISYCTDNAAMIGAAGHYFGRL